jgi:hypothetical protein
VGLAVGWKYSAVVQDVAFIESRSVVAYMIPRRLNCRLNELLRHSPAVVLLGPRQAGKTTLAMEIGE